MPTSNCYEGQSCVSHILLVLQVIFEIVPSSGDHLVYNVLLVDCCYYYLELYHYLLLLENERDLLIEAN